MRAVEFTRPFPPYNAGEVASFSETEATRLVGRGTAKYLDQLVVVATAEAEVPAADVATETATAGDGARAAGDTVATEFASTDRRRRGR